jgi:hypothetical protein
MSCAMSIKLNWTAVGLTRPSTKTLRRRIFHGRPDQGGPCELSLLHRRDFFTRSSIVMVVIVSAVIVIAARAAFMVVAVILIMIVSVTAR